MRRKPCTSLPPARAARRAATYRPRVEPLESRLAPATLPTNFSEAVVASNLSSVTAMELAPDGKLFVTEQAGTMEVWLQVARCRARRRASRPRANPTGPNPASGSQRPAACGRAAASQLR